VREIRTDIEVNAPASRVWRLLTDFEHYPEWNPFIRRVSGRPEPNTKLEVFIQPSGARGMTFRPTVLKAEPERELRWFGRLLLPGLFDGEHIFEIHHVTDNTLKFVQRERFSGLFVPLLWNQLDRDTRRGFNEMNAALKELAESDGPRTA
jgi:hypothetical protein